MPQKQKISRVVYNPTDGQLYPADSAITSATPQQVAKAKVKPQVTKGEVMPPVQGFQMATYGTMATTYQDRARGFRYVMLPVSIVAGGVCSLIGIVNFAVPIISAITLLIFGLGFCLIYTLGWLGTNLFSPEGIDLVNSFFMWRYVKREQDFRMKEGLL